MLLFLVIISFLFLLIAILDLYCDQADSRDSFFRGLSNLYQGKHKDPVGELSRKEIFSTAILLAVILASAFLVFFGYRSHRPSLIYISILAVEIFLLFAIITRSLPMRADVIMRYLLFKKEKQKTHSQELPDEHHFLGTYVLPWLGILCLVWGSYNLIQWRNAPTNSEIRDDALVRILLGCTMLVSTFFRLFK